jgi:hypothetical protein
VSSEFVARNSNHWTTDYNFACNFVCVEISGAREQRDPESNCTEDGRSDRSWMKLRDQEIHDIYSSPNIIGMIKSRG